MLLRTDTGYSLRNSLRNSLIPFLHRILNPSKGWLQKLIAMSYGALATTALAPIYFVPGLIIAFCGILYLTTSSTVKESFWLGWWFGFGYFTAGLYWIAFAMGVDLERFAWMIPFSVFGLPALLSFFIAPVFAFTTYNRSDALERLVFFALLWASSEWLRGVLLTGFPWNLISYSWIDFKIIAQSFSLFGAYGLSFLSVLWAGAPLLWRASKVAVMSIYAILIVLSLFGWERLATTTEDYVPELILRLVQPSIPQILKGSREHAEQNLQTIIDLTNTPTKGTAPDVYLWPESATTFFLAHDAFRRHDIMRSLSPQGLLLTGVTRGQKQQGEIKLWNSLIAIDRQGKVIASYDKSHLVPFGEYLPFRSVLSYVVQKITPGSIDYSPGVGPRTLKIPHVPPFSPLICYEVIFPGAVKSAKEPAPEWLLNITNDAWYGHTSGPYQHLAIAQARAIEEGLPLIRVGNNGISASIDPYGRILKRLELDQVGILDIRLPKPSPTHTLYSQYGDKMLLVLILIAISILFLRRFLRHLKPV